MQKRSDDSKEWNNRKRINFNETEVVLANLNEGVMKK